MNEFKPGDQVLIKYGTFHNPDIGGFWEQRDKPASFVSYMAGRQYAVLLITEPEYYNVRVNIEDILHAS